MMTLKKNDGVKGINGSFAEIPLNTAYSLLIEKALMRNPCPYALTCDAECIGYNNCGTAKQIEKFLRNKLKY